jgi:hypothetical protein
VPKTGAQHSHDFPGVPIRCVMNASLRAPSPLGLILAWGLTPIIQHNGYLIATGA